MLGVEPQGLEFAAELLSCCGLIFAFLLTSILNGNVTLCRCVWEVWNLVGFIVAHWWIIGGGTIRRLLESQQAVLNSAGLEDYGDF